MARYVFLVLTNPVDGRVDDFNEWYDNVHLDEVLGIDGVVSAQRFQYTDVVDKHSPWKYLAIYEWEADTIEAARAALDNARAAGRVTVADSLDPSHTAAWFFEPITERRIAQG